MEWPRVYEELLFLRTYLWCLVREREARATSGYDQIDRIRGIGPQHELSLDQGHRVWDNLGLGDFPAISSILFKDRAQRISGGISYWVLGCCRRYDQDGCFECLAHDDPVVEDSARMCHRQAGSEDKIEYGV